MTTGAIARLYGCLLCFEEDTVLWFHLLTGTTGKEAIDL
jgi:hypothetical protein